MERFTKVRNIGKGNMGACTLARNNDDGRYYVIKQVDLAKLSKKERQQSLNEAKVLSSLRHPNIINYVDSFLARKSDHLCIVMEYADGGDLAQRVKGAHGVNFTQDQILDWAIQCALSLQHIHGRKILHRDVKTQNIFLTTEGLCKVGDFGIARFLNNTFDQASTFVGTPYYLSPELILERPYDAMSDVWAFGVCLYELMALRHPFNASDMKALMQRILKVQYDPPPAVYTPELRGIVTSLLVKDPQQRMKLSEVLDQPIVLRRMQEWLAGGIMPTRYISSLVRHKLFPPRIQPPVAAMSKELPSIAPMGGGGGMALGGAGGGGGPSIRMVDDEGAGGPPPSQLLGAGGPPPIPTGAAAAQRQARKEEIASEFRDIRAMRPAKPTAGPAGGGVGAAGGLFQEDMALYRGGGAARPPPVLAAAVQQLPPVGMHGRRVSDPTTQQQQLAPPPQVGRLPPQLAPIHGGGGGPLRAEPPPSGLPFASGPATGFARGGGGGAPPSLAAIKPRREAGLPSLPPLGGGGGAAGGPRW